MHNKSFKVLIYCYFSKFPLSMSSTQLVVGRAFAAMYDLWVSFPSSINSTSELLKDRKGISRTIFMLVLASKKVSQRIGPSLGYPRAKN